MLGREVCLTIVEAQFLIIFLLEEEVFLQLEWYCTETGSYLLTCPLIFILFYLFIAVAVERETGLEIIALRVNRKLIAYNERVVCFNFLSRIAA